MLNEFYHRHPQRTLVAKAESVGDTYICNETTHYWNEQVVWKVAHFKDAIIDFACRNNYDYVFLIDSDIVMHPNTIEQLIADDKDIISEIFWTNWTPDAPKKPQVWLYDFYTQYETQGESFIKSVH